MRVKLIAFDLDGTLVEDHLVEEGSRLRPRTDRHYTDPVILDGALERVQEARAVAENFALCTNQGGVALGFQTPEEVKTRIARSLALHQFFYSAPITVHYCLDHPNGKGKFANPSYAQLARRKPAPGMIREAMDAAGVGPAETVYIGDRETDRTAAERASCHFLDVETWLTSGLNSLHPTKE